jgi:hypothetical protein
MGRTREKKTENCETPTDSKHMFDGIKIEHVFNFVCCNSRCARPAKIQDLQWRSVYGTSGRFSLISKRGKMNVARYEVAVKRVK